MSIRKRKGTKERDTTYEYPKDSAVNALTPPSLPLSTTTTCPNSETLTTKDLQETGHFRDTIGTPSGHSRDTKDCPTSLSQSETLTRQEENPIGTLSGHSRDTMVGGGGTQLEPQSEKVERTAPGTASLNRKSSTNR